jgi:Domain of unknown function (DUF397)
MDITFSGWRKSSHSAANGNCAEAGQAGEAVAVRDTALAGRSPVLIFPAAAWVRFTASLKSPGNRIIARR